MADSARAARLAKRVQVLMAQSLRTVIKDERIDNVTVTDARVTNDLQHATVYYTVFGEGEIKAEIAEILAKRTGALRKELGRNLTIRLTPTLTFVADEIQRMLRSWMNCWPWPGKRTPRSPRCVKASPSPVTQIHTRRTKTKKKPKGL